MPTADSNSLGLYISIPFCKSKCTYCNFASGVFGSERMAAYVDRLVDEIRGAREKARKWHALLPEHVGTIYFGGGTPSLLSSEHMESILKAMHEEFRFAHEPEITLECAPGQLSDSLLDVLPALGFNRVSLGVQSFVDRETAAVGRLHTRAIVAAQIASLRRAGIDNINVDLIAGLPHQTPESWCTSLEEAISTGVPHLSVYMLDVDEDSRLGREMLSGGSRYRVNDVPDDAAIAEMYTQACERFVAASISQYEISNFARAGKQSRHNLKYWTRRPYLGFGLDAHSFLRTKEVGAIRVGTTDDLTVYLDFGRQETLTPVSNSEAIEESWFLGLRLNEGVSLSTMKRTIGSSAMDAFQPVLRDCEQEGLLEKEGNWIRLTPSGRLFANDVFVRFIGVLPPGRLKSDRLQVVA